MQDIFAAAGHDVNVNQLSLADSSAVWRAIEDGLLSGQSNATSNASWAASSLLPNTPAATVRAEAPMLEFSFSEKVAPLSKTAAAAAPKPRTVNPAPDSAATSFRQDQAAASPAAEPAMRAARLTQAGQLLLSSLLEIDAVVAVGAQCGQNGSATVLIGLEPGLGAAQAQTRELAFRDALNAETGQHATLQQLHPPGGKHNQKILTRWRQHFTLSFDVRGGDLAVVLLQMAETYNNESLVRAAVRACLHNLHDPFFKRV